jgi:hypothetical protein
MPRIEPDYDPPLTGPWRRSGKGNLYRRLPNGECLTIFPRDGGWAWCRADGDSPPRFSRLTYDTEEEALDAVVEELEDRYEP